MWSARQIISAIELPTIPSIGVTIVIGGLAVFCLSLIGTGILRRYAIARSVLDIPNARSSHKMPTPRGGGVAVVVAFLGAILALWSSKQVDSTLAMGLTSAGSAVAIVGFIDDHRHIAARWRLLVHFAAAVCALVSLGGLPPIPVGGATIDLAFPGDVLAAVGLVWLLNLFNFMDGIDGIASVEAITVCVGAVLLYLVMGATQLETMLPMLLALGTLGFLFWNFPPAKIFMGDAGSGFLGITLGVLALDATTRRPEWFWSWIILLGVFVVDATVTLFFRLSRGAKLHEAHRSHAYQHAAQRYGSHRRVTVAVGAINLIWLLPMALLAGTSRLDGLLATVLAYLPLIWVALVYRAGRAPAPQATAA